MRQWILFSSLFRYRSWERITAPHRSPIARRGLRNGGLARAVRLGFVGAFFLVRQRVPNNQSGRMFLACIWAFSFEQLTEASMLHQVQPLRRTAETYASLSTRSEPEHLCTEWVAVCFSWGARKYRNPENHSNEERERKKRQKWWSTLLLLGGGAGTPSLPHSGASLSAPSFDGAAFLLAVFFFFLFFSPCETSSLFVLFVMCHIFKIQNVKKNQKEETKRDNPHHINEGGRIPSSSFLPYLPVSPCLPLFLLFVFVSFVFPCSACTLGFLLVLRVIGGWYGFSGSVASRRLDPYGLDRCGLDPCGLDFHGLDTRNPEKPRKTSMLPPVSTTHRQSIRENILKKLIRTSAVLFPFFSCFSNV